jgi:hypothetical protein
MLPTIVLVAAYLLDDQKRRQAVPGHSTRPVAVAMLVALLGGASATWALMRKGADQEISSVSLAHELEMTALCASALTLIQASEDAKLSAALKARLDTALRHSSSLVDSGVRLGIAGPNLRDAARRAAAYYESRDPSRAQEAERLMQKLKEEQ